jgi:hypothetical protein
MCVFINKKKAFALQSRKILSFWKWLVCGLPYIAKVLKSSCQQCMLFVHPVTFFTQSWADYQSATTPSSSKEFNKGASHWIRSSFENINVSFEILKESALNLNNYNFFRGQLLQFWHYKSQTDSDWSERNNTDSHRSESKESKLEARKSKMESG